MPEAKGLGNGKVGQEVNNTGRDKDKRSREGGQQGLGDSSELWKKGSGDRSAAAGGRTRHHSHAISSLCSSVKAMLQL